MAEARPCMDVLRAMQGGDVDVNLLGRGCRLRTAAPVSWNRVRLEISIPDVNMWRLHASRATLEKWQGHMELNASREAGLLHCSVSVDRVVSTDQRSASEFFTGLTVEARLGEAWWMPAAEPEPVASRRAMALAGLEES